MTYVAVGPPGDEGVILGHLPGDSEAPPTDDAPDEEKDPRPYAHDPHYLQRYIVLNM